MADKDYYKILGVSKGADEATIKKEYRKRARKYHPDVNEDASAEQQFQDLGEAYEVLKDPEKRKAYDAYGADWQHGAERAKHQQQYQRSHAGGGGGFGGFSSGGEDYSDFFESMFGGGGQGRAAHRQKGEDVDVSVKIPLVDAYRGNSREITFQMPSVSAAGRREYKKKTLNIKIPKGVKQGGRIRLKGQGGEGFNGGESGDMYLKIDFEPHARFKVEGADVHLTLPVAPWEAALGAKVKVPTPTGSIHLTIPKGSASGKKMRLKGQGIPAKVPGDLYVLLQVVLPPAEDAKATEVYEAMKELGFDPRPDF
ncbi:MULTISPECIES: DnaJ C-terminal domain-containing protein [unclassified Lentimonas]|uniref:DnaJ C-terminal domain-containing protein n=1 Tax=unclassified Lentimonas TaxID=2630993 RepID=UPI0013256392|nr:MULTISPECIES: DnaJ C-terminal domain-containing protein [unclassified Lentimonas]CAA6676931.1 DnaJ-class molecular chaperone CbpA [Lentimonas sp. CC4]CAA6686737.1 DnaJ-class molecular chaperone CbpA [Lentimonas sp. CC6]CAA7075686.1 DnaJ-class molecular chaperone CbpA [Lentimonas sp. CC4]CAA7168156.1 DnaJ-class molecular chaperone CbpA [Lentimonas sp. CC21]CAA7181696.1 DnaJ-class molecular chaperone CbpA [Lentimonas sp. CC8]